MKSYKQLTEDLEKIIIELRAGDSDIEGSILKFKEASELIKKMETQLKKAEVEINRVGDSIK